MFYQEVIGQDNTGKNLILEVPGTDNAIADHNAGKNGPGASSSSMEAIHCSLYNVTGLWKWSYADADYNCKLVGPNGFVTSQSSSTLNSEVFSGIKTSNPANTSISNKKNIRLIMRNYPGYGVVMYFDNKDETQMSPQALRIIQTPNDTGGASFELSRVSKSSIPNFTTGYTYELIGPKWSSYWINTQANNFEWQAPILIKDSNGYYILKVISEPLANSTYTTGLTLIPITNSKNYTTDKGFIGINGCWSYTTYDSSLEQIKSEMSSMSNKYISR